MGVLAALFNCAKKNPSRVTGLFENPAAAIKGLTAEAAVLNLFCSKLEAIVMNMYLNIENDLRIKQFRHFSRFVCAPLGLRFIFQWDFSVKVKACR